MKALNNNLKLILVVHNNYNHIQDFETLTKLFESSVESDYSKQYPSEYSLSQAQIDHLVVICKTTHNSHYDYNLFKDDMYKNPINHIDKIIKNL